MAIDFFNRYPQNSGAKTPEYPFGSFRNETAPDAKDGTTLEQDWSNDWQAFFGKLLVEASMTPNGTVDTVVMSQYYDALLNLIRKERTKVSDIMNGTQVDVASSENALRRAYENAVASVKKEGDTMTGNLVMQASTQYRDTSIPQNNVGSQFNVKNESGQLVIRRGRADGNASGEQRIVMPNRSGQVALVSDGVGVDQQWRNVTSTRKLNDTYTNTSGKPIVVNVLVNCSSRNVRVRLFVNGVIASLQEVQGSDTTSVTVTKALSVSAIIPAGASYYANYSTMSTGGSGSVTLENWAELR